MALSHFPSCSCTPHKLCSFKIQQHFKWNCESLQTLSPKTLTLACSLNNNSRVSKKPKATKPIKSNADLLNDLREFISSYGLPEDRVPSTNELSRYGRKDLANIVRRRGYRLITELLLNSIKNDTIIERNSAENEDGGNGNAIESTGQSNQTNESAEDVSLSSEALSVDTCSSHAKGTVPINSGIQICEYIESSSDSSFHEEATRFIQDGVLDRVEGTLELEDMQLLNGSFLGNGIPSISVADAGTRCTEKENEMDVESKVPSKESSISEAIESNAASILNAGTVTSEEVTPLAAEPHPPRDDTSSSEGPRSAHFDMDLFFEASKLDNQIEINRLNSLLRQKELELSQLKQQIDNEKFALSILQTKAETEISNVQRIISVKDAELHAVEGSLSGLKEVEIQYWGNGETVEVAGSFNGWHHRIKMDLQSSKNLNANGQRKSVLWTTVLWLYPGVYEIKFIIDGQWMIDSRRELVTSGNIQNNLLRVD